MFESQANSGDPSSSSEGRYRAQADIGPWRVVAFWEPSATGGGPTELVVRPRPDVTPEELARGITTSVLRDIPLTTLMAERKKTTSAYGAGYKAGQETRRAIKRIKLMVEEQPRPGGAGRSDRFFALVAHAYANHARYGESNPIPWLAEQADADRRTAENWVRQARKRGLLTDPAPGVGGGELTEKARSLLAGDRKRSE